MATRRTIAPDILEIQGWLTQEEKRRATESRPVELPKEVVEQVHRERRVKTMRGRRKPKGKTRQIAVSPEILPSGRAKPQRRVLELYYHEKCPTGVNPDCRFCSVALPAKVRVGGKTVADPNIIEGWTVIGPDRKETLMSRRTGKGLEYFTARYPKEAEAYDAAERKSETCQEFGVKRELLVSPEIYKTSGRRTDPESVAPSPPPDVGPPLGPAVAKPKQQIKKKRKRKKVAAPKKKASPKKKKPARRKKALSGYFAGFDGPLRWGESAGFG